MTSDVAQRLIGPWCCRARLRETHRPGATPHWIPVLHAAQEAAFRRGVLLDVREYEFVVSFAEDEPPVVLATLWIDRFVRAAEEPIERDGYGRPIVLWSPRWTVAKLLALDHRNPVFMVVDVRREPDAVAAWSALAKVCPDGACRSR